MIASSALTRTASSGPVLWALLVAVAIGWTASAARWLRVAQREHYLAGSATRFAVRWWKASVANEVFVILAALAALVAVTWVPAAALLTAVIGAFAPLGLDIRGRTSALVWTKRLRRLAVTLVVLSALGVGLGAIAGLKVVVGLAAIAVVTAPVVTDLAMLAVSPVEKRLMMPFVERAKARLHSVKPKVVAITGSYGKTTTKGYVAHLLAAGRSVMASPASFNNMAGLARALNEHLAVGTEVFVAEMGTYGPGEIAKLCSWIPPDVSVITALGPVHLERMRSEERIATAKAEILKDAPVAVVNVDHPLLARVAQEAAESGKVVWRCSSISLEESGSLPVDVVVVSEGEELRVWARIPAGQSEQNGLRAPGADLVEIGAIGSLEPSAGNVACAVAVSLSLGADPESLARLLKDLPTPAHRRTVQSGSTGVITIDDTYNSNPAGARAALSTLARVGSGRRVVITPGMVELGRRQRPENTAFAAACSQVATDLVIVGHTNAASLQAGAKGTRMDVHAVSDRAGALEWVKRNLQAGDAVLWENDLPDHYP